MFPIYLEGRLEFPEITLTSQPCPVGFVKYKRKSSYTKFVVCGYFLMTPIKKSCMIMLIGLIGMKEFQE